VDTFRISWFRLPLSRFEHCMYGSAHRAWVSMFLWAGAPLEEGARFAFAVFSTLAVEAAQHRLPLRLDW